MRPAASAILAIAAILYAPALHAADNQSPTIWRTTAHSIFERLIAINTADSTGSTTTAAEAVATILKSAGWPEGDIHIVGSNPRRKNLIARYRGTGEKEPILLLAHLDVVEAGLGLSRPSNSPRPEA